MKKYFENVEISPEVLSNMCKSDYFNYEKMYLLFRSLKRMLEEIPIE
jgi:hypothetical protein